MAFYHTYQQYIIMTRMSTSSSDFINPHFATTLIDTFAKKDNWHHIDRKTNNLGYGFLHYVLIRLYQPKRILIIGSKYGYIPGICAIAVRDNNKGHIDFVDAGFDPSESHRYWGGVGHWKTKEAMNDFKRLKIEKYVTLHVMTSQDFWIKNKHAVWDYVYFDGDHSFNGIERDMNLFFPKIAVGGLCLLHDINSVGGDGKPYGVNTYWHTIIRHLYPSRFVMQGAYGLGIIQKERRYQIRIVFQMVSAWALQLFV